MAQPTSPTENTLAVSLPGDVVSHVVSFLKLETLCALHATGTKNGCPDEAWRVRIPQNTLFALKQPKPFTTFRNRWAEWSGARRSDLVVLPGRFRFHGTVEDRKGVCRSTGRMDFSAKLVCVGCVQHTRVSSGAKLEGRGYGHLCANILPANGKRGWALAWKEKVDEAAGYYSYVGSVRTLSDGSLVWSGSFSWFGRLQGAFRFELRRDDGTDEARYRAKTKIHAIDATSVLPTHWLISTGDRASSVGGAERGADIGRTRS